MSVIFALRKLRQEDCLEFEASIGYIVNISSAKAIH